MCSLPNYISLLLLVSVTISSSLTAQSVKQYPTQAIRDTIQIDGFIQESAWESVSWGGGLIQTEPENGKVPTHATRFKVIHDKSHLYVAIRAFDQSPDSIVVADSPRDFFEGDYVEINIDSNLDGETAYSFTATAGGIRGDEYIRTSDNWENDWNPTWELATQLDAMGWVAEFKIPVTELNYFEKKRHWGLQINRSLERLDEGSSWSPVPDEDQWVASFGLLTGIEEIPVSRAPELAAELETQPFKADLRSLQNTLKQSYPSLYRYRTTTEIDQHFNEVIDQINSDLTLLDAYKYLCKVLSNIGDGHMQVKFPEKVISADFNSRRRLPFKLQINEKGSWIKASYVEGADFLHAQLLSINRRSMDDITSELLTYIPSDGLNQTGKYFRLSENFNFYHSLISDAFDSITIQYQTEKGAVQQANLALLSNAKIGQLRSDSGQRPFELSYHENVALMRISTFNYPQAFQKFVNESFQELTQNQTSELILDLRGNGGGEETNAIHLYSYLATKPFKYYDRYEVNPGTIETVAYPSLASYETINFLGKMAILNQDSVAELSKIEMLEGRFIDPNDLQSLQRKHRFEGEVIVLIDGGSFSATSELCAIMRRDRRVTFVGEETGGTFDGNTSGIYDQITLPHSRINVRIPLVKYVSAVENTSFEYGRGIIPDHSTSSIPGQEDATLKYALDLLKSR